MEGQEKGRLTGWLNFLEMYYKKQFRTFDEIPQVDYDAFVVWPDVTEVTKFYMNKIDRYDNKVIGGPYHLKFDTTKNQILLEKKDKTEWEPILLKDLRRLQNETVQGGGRRRRSRKAKKGPSPQ
jgi:hypothetical protein